MLRATTACTFSTSQLPKVLRPWCVLYILTSKCASRHNAVHFFNISTSKTAPNPSVFNTVYFQVCFGPKRRVIFSTSQLPKVVRRCPTLRCFVPFHFEIGFAPQRRAIFSSLISPDVSAPAALASLLFDPPEPQNREKTQCFATFRPFHAPASSFF